MKNNVRLNVELISVVDGDTIWIWYGDKKRQVRLVGINAFENESNKSAFTQAKKHELSIDEVIELGEKAKTFFRTKINA